MASRSDETGSISLRLVVAAAIAVVTSAVTAIALALLMIGHATLRDVDPTSLALPFTMAIVGVIIVMHVPRNPIG